MPNALLELDVPEFSKLPACMARGFLEICSSGSLREQVINMSEDINTYTGVGICAGSITKDTAMSLIWQDDLDKAHPQEQASSIDEWPLRDSGKSFRRKAAVHCMRGRALLACCVGLDAGVPPAQGPLTELQCHVLMHG